LFLWFAFALILGDWRENLGRSIEGIGGCILDFSICFHDLFCLELRFTFLVHMKNERLGFRVEDFFWRGSSRLFRRVTVSQEYDSINTTIKQ